MRQRIISLLIIISALNFSSAQTRVFNHSFKKDQSSKNSKQFAYSSDPGHICFNIYQNDTLKIVDLDMTEMMDVIVQFKDRPLFMQKKIIESEQSSALDVKERHAQFSADILKIHDASGRLIQKTFGLPEKKMEFYKLFNGVSIRIPRIMLSAIAALDYVEKVSIEKKFKVNLDESVKLIGADSIWYKYNNMGDSVVIGIIDTGIDYLHPALGGGIGKGYKVIGGYDFVNKDNDPMDDYGHGTHVAGIAAADGETIKGVAPKALLMAFKVLNETGEGTESDIIAGLERAADPNEDDSFDDKADIVNMSLGNSAGGPDDPISNAVNNAVSIGMVVCVAAGNDGTYNSIGSPGSASLAITVGAVSKSEILASFSSKGPSKENYFIKPDVLAPGINIRSTIPNGNYEEHSGTSMASPHAAGLCALIKHMHKDWNPEMIKSVIMNSAKDLGLDAMSQGAGEINALKAFNLTSIASPSSINFGEADESNEQWTQKNSITITNLSNSLQNYSILINGQVPGVSIAASQNSFTIAAKGTKEITFTLNADNRIVPEADGYSHSISGIVQIITQDNELNLPWAFIKSPKLVLEFDKPILFYDIYSSKHFFNDLNASNTADLYRSELLLPADNYNMFFVFGELKNGVEEYSCVIKENVNISKSQVLTISSGEANFPIDFKGVDENGRELGKLKNSIKNLNFACKDLDKIVSIFLQLKQNQVLKSSRFSNDIFISAGEFQTSLTEENKVRVIQYPIHQGLEESVTFSNSSSDFLKQEINLSLSPEEKQSNAAFANVIRFSAGIMGDYIYYSVDKNDLIRSKVWDGTLFITPEINAGYGYTTKIITDVLENKGPVYTETSRRQMWFNTDIFRTKSDSMGCFDFKATQYTFFSPDGGIMNLGDGAIYPDVMGSVYEDGANYKIYITSQFFGQIKEFRISDFYRSTYSLKDSIGTVIARDSLPNLQELTVPGGKYKFEINNNNYTVANRYGKASLISEFDVRKISHEPPRMVSLEILNSKGSPGSFFKKGETGSLVCYAANPLFHWLLDTAASKVFIKISGTDQWQELKVTRRANAKLSLIRFSGDISKYTLKDSTSYDLKISLVNFEDFKTDWILEPAFIVGSYGYTGTEGPVQTKTAPNNYMLYSNYPNPFNPLTKISYDIPKRSSVEVIIFDMLGREVFTAAKEEQEAGHYELQFNGNNLSSGIYICRMKAGNYTKTLKMLLLK